MEIEMVAWWGGDTSVTTMPKTILNAEEILKASKKIYICAIVIDGKHLGEVAFDGTKLSLEETT